MGQDRPATRGDVRRRADRKTLAISLLLSVVVHFLALNLRLDPVREDSQTEGDGAPTRTVLDAIQVLELLVQQAPPPVPTVEIDEAAPIPFEPPSVEADEEPESVITEPASDVPARPTFGARLRDPRLWGPITPPSGTGPLIGNQPRALLDSLNEESRNVRPPAAGDMSVWTTRDAEGNRWGFSPGRIHFGSVVLPTCGGNFDASNCGIGVPPSFREEYRNQLRGLSEIQQQGNRAFLEERARAIRAHLEAVRDSIPPP